METNDPVAALAETHSAVVILYGDRAYKIKKPVRTDFLDFSTRAARRSACDRELELYRRFAPDVYLGVGHLSAPPGEADEPVLVMRRLPEATRLSHRLDDPAVARDTLALLMRQVAGWHDRAPSGPQIDRAATVDAVRERRRSLLSGLSCPPIEHVSAAGSPVRRCGTWRAARHCSTNASPPAASSTDTAICAQATSSSGAVRLVLIGGLPGTGKSTIACRLTDATGPILLSSDHIRAGLRDGVVVAGVSGEYDRRTCTPAAREHVYATMRGEAQALLSAGRSVVLDASWIDATQRHHATRPAADTAADLIEICCRAPQSATTVRIAARTGSQSEGADTLKFSGVGVRQRNDGSPLKLQGISTGC